MAEGAMMHERDKTEREEEHERTFTSLPCVPAKTEKRAYLLALEGPQFGAIFPLAAKRELIVGRRGDSDIQIKDDSVSRRHASVCVDGRAAMLKDLGSANGTYVDGKRISEARVEDGARIQMGSHTILKFIFADELDARYQMKLAEGALRDPLTGLYNRRHLDERLAAELAGAQRHGRPVSVLMIDIDHFKRLNDLHGHLAGDEALKMVATVLHRAVRKEDVLARYGGEEFVVVARETEIEGAHAQAERMRLAVEHSVCAFKGRALCVTVSAGAAVAAKVIRFEPGRSERAMLEKADRALYLAKQAGRNRVVALPMEKDSLWG